jgi:UDP:flavonoid glycosyltransferase YjiC (YdhE family)
MLRRVLLLPIGSSGDVNPFLWIGRLLRERGHEVSVIANPVFADAIAALDLRCVPFGDDAEFHAMLGHPDVWHPIKGPPLVLRYAGEVTARHFALIQGEIDAASSAPLVLAPATAFGARLAWEKSRFPLVTVNLQPCVLMAPSCMPLMVRGFEWMQAAPLPVRRILLRLIQAQIGALVRPGVRRACQAVGVRPPANAFRDWWQSPDGAACLWPEWLAAPQPDWPPRAACVGFPLYDLADQIPLAPELAAFLDGGDAPILFTPGTAMAQGAQFFRTALAACRQIKRLAIFATKFADQLPADLPAEVFHVNYSPFSTLLPRCAGIVHHGGIGTTAQAFAAGIPQLIMPLSHDQPDNAARVRQLGCGDWLWPRDFTPPNAARKLRALLADETLRQRCGEVAKRVRSEDPAPRLLAALAPHLHD